MAYVLENKDEFTRLELQSQFEKYDYKEELKDFLVPSHAKILDAGCGSGVISRYLSQLFPTAEVHGYDFSKIRVALAKKVSAGLQNIHYHEGNLAQLKFKSNFFDASVCRYVLEHLTPTARKKTLKEIFRCLKPSGIFHAIDFDGPLVNLYPQTPLISKVVKAFGSSTDIDLQMGRKMPHLLKQAGFEEIKWRIQTFECHGKILEDELKILPPKLEAIIPIVTRFLGSAKKARQFNHEFLQTMQEEGSVLFYNKFIVSGKKAPLLKKIK